MGGSIIFAGCSFTWGQGLWSYCPTDLKVPTVNEYIEDNYPVPEVAEFFRIDNRFAGLVSKRFDARQIVKRYNGGTDEESLRFIKEVENNWVTDHSLLTTNVAWDTVKYIIFQTTQPYRSPFTFHYKGKEYQVFSTPNLRNLERVQEVVYHGEKDGRTHSYIEHDNIDIFLDYLIDNNISVEDFEKIHLEFMTNEIKKTLKHYEETHNIKTLLLVWTDDYLHNFLNDEWCNERLVRLNYNNKTFNSIQELFREDNKFEILNDDETVHESGNDGHPSLKCHRVIADSLIQKMTDINEKQDNLNNE